MKYIYPVVRFSMDDIKNYQQMRKRQLEHNRERKKPGYVAERGIEQRKKFLEMERNPTIEFLQEQVSRLKMSLTHPNTTGYFAKVSDAKAAILNGGQNIHEGWYDVICIEEVAFGYVDAWAMDIKGWYKFDRDTQQYKQIDRPAWSLGLFGFSH